MGSVVSLCCALSSSATEELLHVSVWDMISFQLTTDGVVTLRTAARRWNAGDSCGGHILLATENDQFEKTWHYDEQGRRTYTMLRPRNPIVDGVRRFRLHLPPEGTADRRPRRGGFDLIRR